MKNWFLLFTEIYFKSWKAIINTNNNNLIFIAVFAYLTKPTNNKAVKYIIDSPLRNKH